MKKVLRIYLSHLCADQSWQVPAVATVDPSVTPIPSWTFRVEGYLIDVMTDVTLSVVASHHDLEFTKNHFPALEAILVHL